MPNAMIPTAHERAEPRQAAAVGDDVREVAVARDAEAEAVASAVEPQRAIVAARDAGSGGALNFLHLAERGAPDGSGLGTVARRPRGEKGADIHAQVARRGEHAAHRAERAVG